MHSLVESTVVRVFVGRDGYQDCSTSSNAYIHPLSLFIIHKHASADGDGCCNLFVCLSMLNSTVGDERFSTFIRWGSLELDRRLSLIWRFWSRASVCVEGISSGGFAFLTYFRGLVKRLIFLVILALLISTFEFQGFLLDACIQLVESDGIFWPASVFISLSFEIRDRKFERLFVCLQSLRHC